MLLYFLGSVFVKRGGGSDLLPWKIFKEDAFWKSDPWCVVRQTDVETYLKLKETF